MKTYTVGILGFGFIGKVHAYAHQTMALYYPQADFRTRITHIGTSTMATAKKGCVQVQAEVPVTDYREITENPQIDIVHICTPNHLHKDMLLSAIANNKHIYCDKPLVLNADDAGISDQPLGGTKGWTSVDCGQRYPESHFPGPKFSIGWMRAHVACLFNFINHVSKGEPCEPGFDQGLYIQHIIERVRESAKQREWVQI